MHSYETVWLESKINYGSIPSKDPLSLKKWEENTLTDVPLNVRGSSVGGNEGVQKLFQLKAQTFQTGYT